MEPGLKVFAFRRPKSIFEVPQHQKNSPPRLRLGHFFKNSNNMTTGEAVLMLCFRFAGMWTQLPD